jgi:hypothetical protein
VSASRKRAVIGVMLTWYRDLHDGSEYGGRELVFRVVNVVLAFDDNRLGGDGEKKKLFS